MVPLVHVVYWSVVPAAHEVPVNVSGGFSVSGVPVFQGVPALSCNKGDTIPTVAGWIALIQQITRSSTRFKNAAPRTCNGTDLPHFDLSNDQPRDFVRQPAIIQDVSWWANRRKVVCFKWSEPNYIIQVENRMRQVVQRSFVLSDVSTTGGTDAYVNSSCIVLDSTSQMMNSVLIIRWCSGYNRNLCSQMMNYMTICVHSQMRFWF